MSSLPVTGGFTYSVELRNGRGASVPRLESRVDLRLLDRGVTQEVPDLHEGDAAHGEVRGKRVTGRVNASALRRGRVAQSVDCVGGLVAGAPSVARVPGDKV
jgi:hypothetical protein